MENEFSVRSLLCVGIRRDADGIQRDIYDDSAEQQKACELYAVTRAMAADMVARDPKLKAKSDELAKPYQTTGVKLLADDLCTAYGQNRWSLFTDKPTRPAAKTAAPETLDA